MKTRFDSLTPELMLQRKTVHEVCRVFNKSPSKGNLKRLKQLFNTYGEHLVIESGFYCDYADKISIGSNVFININCTILDAGMVTIGDHCLIGPNVQILAVQHDVDPILRLEKHNYADDVTLGNNVWLGAGVIVLPGVTIDDNCVIGAGSVVTKSTEKNALYVGNPAKKVKSI